MGKSQLLHWVYVLSMALGLLACIYCLTTAIVWGTRELWSGRLVMNASRPKSRFLVSSFLVYFAIWLVGAIMSPRRFLMSYPVVMLIYSGTALFFARVLEVRERGIFHDSELIAWKRIAAWDWEWQYAASGFAILKLELNRPLFFRRSIRIEVQRSVIDGLSQALQAHVHEAP